MKVVWWIDTHFTKYWTWNREYSTWTQQALSMKNAVHTYICKWMWKYMKGLYIDRHTHTDAFITNNPSQQQQWYKAATGHLRHTAAQSTTAIWRPTFHRHWRTILKSTGKASHHQGTSYKPTVSYCASREHYKPLLLNSSGVTKLLIQAKRQTTADITALGSVLHKRQRWGISAEGICYSSQLCMHVLHYKVIEDWGTRLHGI